MKKYQVCMLAFVLLALASLRLVQASKAEQRTGSIDAHRSHSVVSADDLKWVAAPPTLPPGAQFAVLDGDRSAPGQPYTFRAKLPDGYSVPPHWHSMDERITVIQGVFGLGLGEKFDKAKIRDLPAGSFIMMPKGDRTST